MTPVRPSCSVLLAVLLVALPTHADDKKKQSANRASPQNMQRQQSNSQPTLPDDGTKLSNAKAPSTGGAAGSVNTGKPMAPVGTQTIGGEQTGGAAAAGAALGTTTTSAQPKSGDTLVNPNAPNTQTGGAMPGDFSRDKKLQGAVDGGASAVTNQATTSSAPGQQSGAALIGGTQSNFDAMRGDPGSRTSQQGMMPNTTAGPPVFLPEVATGVKTDYSTIFPKQQTQTISSEVKMTSGDNAGTAQGTASGIVMDKTRSTTTGAIENAGAATRMTGATLPSAGTTSVPSQPKLIGLSATPSPDGGAGTPVPASVKNLGGKSPTLEQAKKERGRQTGMPIDDKQQIDRMKADQRAASATMADRRVNTTNPGDQGAISGTFSGAPKSGVNTTESKGGKSGCSADNPSC